METVYLNPEGEMINPHKSYKGVSNWPAGALFKQSIREIEAVTTKQVTMPAFDPDTQSKPVQGGDGEYAQPVDLSFEDAKERKLASFRQRYELEMQLVRSGYTESEIASWDKQEAEAKAWDDDNAASTPFIDALATARGITKTDLVSKILAKTAMATTYTATQTGIRQALEDAVDVEAAKQNPSTAALRAITWPD